MHVFADRYVSATDPPPNLSAYLAVPSEKGPQELHRLYLGHRRVLRTRSVHRVLEAVWDAIDGFEAGEISQRLQLDATVLLEGGRAHLLAPARRTWVADDERCWQREGFQLLDRFTVMLDVENGTIEIPASGLVWHHAVQGCVGASGLADRREHTPRPWGRFAVASWTPSEWPVTPAGRLVRAATQIRNRQKLNGGRLLESLAALLDRLPDGVDVLGSAALRAWLRQR